MIKCVRYLADDLKTDALPQLYSKNIALYDEVKLHRSETQSAGFVQRPKGDLFSNTLSMGDRRDHLRRVTDMRSEARLVGL